MRDTNSAPSESLPPLPRLLSTDTFAALDAAHALEDAMLTGVPEAIMAAAWKLHLAAGRAWEAAHREVHSQ